MNFKLTQFLLCVGVLASSCLFAQAPAGDPAITEEKKETPLTLSGQVDAYYRFSSAKALGATSYTPATNAFGLGMANIAATKDLGKVSFTADLMFGPRAEETNYNDKTTSTAFIKQLFMTYKPTDKIKFTVGNFMTFVGYELVEASNNLNYSMSYNYTNGPFHHTGIKADFALSDKLNLMVGAFQPTDFKTNVLGNGGNINFGGQLSYVDGGLKVYLNALTGPTPKSATIDSITNTAVIDLTAMYQISDKVGLGLEVMNKSVSINKNDKKLGDATSFLGISTYLNYAVSDKFVIAGRYENFNDSKDVTGLYAGSKINAFTLSGNIKIDALTIIPEVRFDSASEKAYNGEKSDVSLILAMVYKF